MTITARNSAVAVVVLVLLLGSSDAFAQDNKNVSINYQGQLKSSDNKPIAGVFPLEFKLYRKEGDDRAMWSEKHWVAVEDGEYALRLGGVRRIRSSLADGKPLFLGVTLSGGGELVREPITLTVDDAAAAEDPSTDKENDKPKPKSGREEDSAKPKAAKPKTDEKTSKKPVYTTESSFAEVAEYAKRSGTAEDAEKLGGKTLDELEAEIERLQSQVAELRAKARGDGGLSDETTVLPRAGGKGGTPFERTCPEGYVVTGLRGGSGALIDRIEVICTRLE